MVERKLSAAAQRKKNYESMVALAHPLFRATILSFRYIISDLCGARAAWYVTVEDPSAMENLGRRPLGLQNWPIFESFLMDTHEV